MITHNITEPVRAAVDRAPDGQPRLTFTSALLPGVVWVHVMTDDQLAQLALDATDLLATGPDPDEQPTPITSAARIRERDLPGLRLRRGGAA